jgi:hypothetical protein
MDPLKTEPVKKMRRLVDIEVEEVSLVDKAANKRVFPIIKKDAPPVSAADTAEEERELRAMIDANRQALAALAADDLEPDPDADEEAQLRAMIDANKKALEALKD